MSFFGPTWEGYEEKIARHWNKLVSKEDLVLIPGDICWAMHLEEALIDLAWIDALSGTKLLLRGNHDYWWSSSAKMARVMPPSIHFIHNTVFNWNDATIGGSRLWDTEEYHFGAYVVPQDNPREKKKPRENPEESEKIFVRELERLKLSLSQLNPKARHRIAMTHYPPIGADLNPSRASLLLEEYKIDTCVFGHLHNLRPEPLFGEKNGIRYILTSCDYLNFLPLKIFDAT